MTYWDGDHESNAIGCQCSDDMSCTESEDICNCDSRGDGEIDFGVITSMEQLPVTKD